MATASAAANSSGKVGLLARERTVAPAGWSRWLVPPAALAVHLAIGQVYAFSVFVKPLAGLKDAQGGHWNLKEVGYIFSMAIVVLSLAATLFGKWIERAGVRKALVAAAVCFGLGFVVAAVGVQLHSLPIVYLGYGVIGGIGLGLGYITPVGTLIKWFPDKTGLATGLAIMGFGGGALIGSPLTTQLSAYYKTHTGFQPIAATMVTMGAFYFLLMMFGALLLRVPRPDWRPAGWTPPADSASKTGLTGTHNVTASSAMHTPQFWLLWTMLFLNVTAGISILESAAPMIQNFFPGRVSAIAAGGFVGVLSLFNMGGRIVWSSLSDYVGRKLTFTIFLVLGTVLFFVLPGFSSVPLFVLTAGVLISMYGGGFSTAPAYLKDLFGTQEVSAIYGRLLTAWSTAGVVGPLLVNAILDNATAAGQPLRSVYPLILHIMTALLAVGIVLSLLVRPVAQRYWMEPAAAE